MCELSPLVHLCAGGSRLASVVAKRVLRSETRLVFTSVRGSSRCGGQGGRIRVGFRFQCPFRSVIFPHCKGFSQAVLPHPLPFMARFGSQGSWYGLSFSFSSSFFFSSFFFSFLLFFLQLQHKTETHFSFFSFSFSFFPWLWPPSTSSTSQSKDPLVGLGPARRSHLQKPKKIFRLPLRPSGARQARAWTPSPKLDTCHEASPRYTTNPVVRNGPGPSARACPNTLLMLNPRLPHTEL